MCKVTFDFIAFPWLGIISSFGRRQFALEADWKNASLCKKDGTRKLARKIQSDLR